MRMSLEEVFLQVTTDEECAGPRPSPATEDTMEAPRE